ncbi:hypothetical protein Droror1_Dr00007071 [Drosera rotundifolia]
MVGGGQNGNKKKKKRGGCGRRKMTAEQAQALRDVNEWVYSEKRGCDESASDDDDDFRGFLPRVMRDPRVSDQRVSFELHCHSIFSDGFLSPKALVEKAHQNGVKVLALTDHDTMAGIPEVQEAAQRYGIKVIPGVEISTIFSLEDDPASEEPVHILAYYSSCGPSRYEKVEKFLANIRDGRFVRAKNMVSKLNILKVPVKWERVMKIAGSGTAPGRLHVARALVEAGYVTNLKQAFARYLYDDGPAYSRGSEPSAEEAVRLICDTGGLAVLAHPWSLKNPALIVRYLKEAGLHGIETYRGDGKLSAYSDLADAYGLVKLGGSDYHGRGGNHESLLGSVTLPVLEVDEFLKLARPIWCNAIRNILERYAEDPSVSNLENITRFEKTRITKGTCGKDLINTCLSLWLTREEVQTPEFQVTMSKLSLVAAN